MDNLEVVILREQLARAHFALHSFISVLKKANKDIGFSNKMLYTDIRDFNPAYKLAQIALEDEPDPTL